MYYAKGIIPLTKIFGRGLHSQQPKGGFAIISHLIALNKMVQLTKYFRTEFGGCLYLEANTFCHLCRLNILHADGKVAGCSKARCREATRTMLTGEGFQHQPARAGGRGTAPGRSAATKPWTLQQPSDGAAAAFAHTRTPDTEPTARQRLLRPPRAASPAPLPGHGPGAAPALQSHGAGCPTIAVSSKPSSSLQTCTFSAFAAPSCGDSASVQTRGQLRTGRDGNSPLPPPPPARRARAAPAGGSGAPGRAARTPQVPGTERGWMGERRCQKHRGHWHSPDRPGSRGQPPALLRCVYL